MQYSIIGILLLFGIGVMVDIVGGVTVRSYDTSLVRSSLTVDGYMKRGGSTTIHWDTLQFVGLSHVSVYLRTSRGIVPLKHALYQDGVASFQISCSVQEGMVTLELVKDVNKALIAWKKIFISSGEQHCQG